MAGEERHFGHNEGGVMFVIGLLAGTALGVGLGMLFAPKSGSELRNQLSRQAGTLADQVQGGYRQATENVGRWAVKGKDAAADIADRGKAMYTKARDAVAGGADEAQQAVRDAAGAVSDTGGGSQRG